MRDFHRENLCHDPIHGYIPFTSGEDLPAGEVSERQIIDHPWVQRFRFIHQLQTAWWVYPSAEHTRFQHVLGVMHLASPAVEALYDSLHATCDDTPSKGCAETLLRMAGLLHDVGHGPFGHFFDRYFLSDFGHTHETLGQAIICDQLGGLLTQVRCNPNSKLSDNEQLDPQHVARHIFRPHTQGPASGQNFLYDSARDRVRPLTTNALFRRTPVSQRICRVYAQSAEYANEVARALDALAGEMPEDDLTNV